MNLKNQNISISKAYKRFYEVARDIQKPFKVWTLTHRGNRRAVLMSTKTYQALKKALTHRQGVYR